MPTGAFVRLSTIPNARDVFGGVDIAGGISYFLWDSSWNGKCEVTTIRGDEAAVDPMSRHLDDYDILVRYNEAIGILERGPSNRLKATPFESVAARVSPIQAVQHSDQLSWRREA